MRLCGTIERTLPFDAAHQIDDRRDLVVVVGARAVLSVPLPCSVIGRNRLQLRQHAVLQLRALDGDFGDVAGGQIFDGARRQQFAVMDDGDAGSR